jgi:hypothetical protein
MSDGDDEYEVESIVDSRIVSQNSKIVKQYFVKWKGFPHSQNTWEPIGNLTGCRALVERFEKERKRGNHASDDEEEEEEEEEEDYSLEEQDHEEEEEEVEDVDDEEEEEEEDEDEDDKVEQKNSKEKKIQEILSKRIHPETVCIF